MQDTACDGQWADAFDDGFGCSFDGTFQCSNPDASITAPDIDRPPCYLHPVDALRHDDLRAAREIVPAEKLRQAIDVMQAGLKVQREKLRRQLPNATSEELERAFEAWLFERD